MSNQPDTFPPFPTGYRIGRFEILKQLADGGQGQVYLARLWQPNLEPAERILRHLKWFGATPAYIEAQALCTLKIPKPRWVENLRDEHTYLLNPNLRHPHIIRIWDRAEEGVTERRKLPKGLWFTQLQDQNGNSFELPYIALPYEPGGSIKDLLKKRNFKPLPPRTAVAIALQIAQALQHMHEQAHLVHHDIAPSNVVFRNTFSIWRTSEPYCVLIDLAAADSPRAPRLRHIYGRRIYLAPERRSKPPKPIDWPVDVYGLGITLYEMLNGQLPRPGTMSTSDFSYRLPHIQHKLPKLSSELASLVMQSIEHNPEHRPSIQQFIQQLKATPEARLPGKLRGPWEDRSRLQAALSATAALLITLLVALSVVAFSNNLVVGSTNTAPTSPPATITPIASPVPASPTPLMPTSTPALLKRP